jgi:hypothetical protein
MHIFLSTVLSFLAVLHLVFAFHFLRHSPCTPLKLCYNRGSSVMEE